MGNSLSMASTVLRCHSYKLHGVGNACVLRATLGPWLRIQSRRSRLWCFGVMCQLCTEHRTTGGSSGCYLLKEPVHKILQKSNRVCKILHRNELGIHGTFIPPVKATPCCPSRCPPRVGFGHHPVTKTAFKRTRSRPVKRCSLKLVYGCLWYGKLPTHKGTKHWKRFFKVSELSFQTEPQQGVHVPCIIHSTFQPRMRASDSMQNSQTTNDVSVCKCMSMYWIYKNVWTVKCDQNRSWFPALSANAPSIIKLHVYPPERKTLHLCS